MEIELNDKFNVKDSTSKIRGIVFAYDENGKLIFKKENMIVEEGRKFILRKVFGLEGAGNSFFDFAAISDCTNVVTPRDNFNDTFNNYIPASIPFPEGIVTADNFDSFDVNTYDELEDRNYFSYFIDATNLVVKCIICFNGNDNISASSLGLIVNSTFTDVDTTSTNFDPDVKYFKKDANNHYFDAELINEFPKDDTIYTRSSSELFSRLTFPTYYKSNNQRLTFKYYIYF